MILSVAQLARLAEDAYDPAYPWSRVTTFGDTFVGHLIDPVRRWLHTSPQGTDNLEDARKDAESVLPWTLPGVGEVPYGFQLGMPETYAVVRGVLQPGWVWTLSGHSAGADQAGILASIARGVGVTPSAVCLLASARTGAAVAARLAGCPNVYSFVNQRDPVPNFPLLWDRPVARPYVLNSPPALPLVDVEWHAVKLYNDPQRGVPSLGLPDFDAPPITIGAPAS